MANAPIACLVGSDVKEREGLALCVGGMADAAVLHIANTYPTLLCSAEFYSALLSLTAQLTFTLLS